MRTVTTLDELTGLAQKRPPVRPLVTRSGRGCRRHQFRRPNGTRLPGLSASSLAVEPWWGDRLLWLWIARRLHDYSYLEHDKEPGVRLWVLEAEELGRGPDNEPLVGSVQPVAWIADEIIAEAEGVVAGQNTGWGSLRRPG